MAKPKPKKPEDLSYEEAFDELEDLVEQLESGDLKLEDALAAFERGQVLAARCSELLEQAQLRLKELVPDEAGGFEVVDLEAE